MSETERLFLRDAYQQTCRANVIDVDPDASTVALDRTVFYATSGGQPHDTGQLVWADGAAAVHDVKADGAKIWHALHGGLPAVGTELEATIDWDLRHQLMRTHTAMHLLCGVIFNEWGQSVTGGNMKPLEGRMDFAFDPFPEGFADRVTEMVNAEIAADRPIEISFLGRGVALTDEALIRTKVNLIPESVTEVRVVDIVGLDRQADGGTHVASTAEVGHFEVTKTESKGKGFRRVRVAIG
jgi:misacylated tRNA(Ala) deacylase